MVPVAEQSDRLFKWFTKIGDRFTFTCGEDAWPFPFRAIEPPTTCAPIIDSVI